MIDQNVTARHLKGCPATILIALLFAGRALGVRDLTVSTGYGRTMIYDSLATLEAANLVRKIGKRWALPATFGRLALPETPSENRTKKCFFRTDLSDSVSHARGFAAATAAIHPVDGSSSSSKQASENRTIAKMLIDAGIGRNSAKLQAILDAGLDADFVRAHVAAWQAARAAGEAVGVGLLITRLLDGDPAPAPPAPPVDVSEDYVTRMMEIYGAAGAGIAF